MHPGARVKWVGDQSEWCAPGYTGTVLKVAHHDEDSLKIKWDEVLRPDGTVREWVAREAYTWERRANIEHADDDPAAALVLA